MGGSQTYRNQKNKNNTNKKMGVGGVTSGTRTPQDGFSISKNQIYSLKNPIVAEEEYGDNN